MAYYQQEQRVTFFKSAVRFEWRSLDPVATVVRPWLPLPVHALASVATVVVMKWLLVLCCTAAVAQDPPTGDPFGNPGPAPSNPPTATATADTASDSTDQKAASQDPVKETDPVVIAILDLQPSSPEQLIRAAESLANLNRADLAKKYLQQLLEAKPSEHELVLLQQRFGSPLFIRLARETQLQPEGAAVSAAVMRAADLAHHDRKRLSDVIDQLSHTDPSVRQKALATLLQAGTVAVDPLVQVLADSQRETEHAAIKQLLVTLGDDAIPPLLAAMAATSSQLHLQLISILGEINSKEAVPALLRPAFAAKSEAEIQKAANQAIRNILGDLPSKDEAIDFLARRLERNLAAASSESASADEQSLLPMWKWNKTEHRIQMFQVSAHDASIQAAAEIAGALHAIAPEQADYRRIYLVAELEIAKRLVGFDQPLVDSPNSVRRLAATTEVGELEEVLALARTRQMEGAAIAVTGILGDSGNSQLLDGNSGQPRELTLALLSPFRRVRFAAASAIVKLDPQVPYPGCSHLPNVLSYLATSAGQRKVLIGHPRTEIAQTLAGTLSGLGYSAETATTGRQVILQAAASPDLIFIVISDRIARPQQTELLQILRRDIRTAKLTIGLTYRELNRDRAKHLADLDPLTLAFPFPHTEQDVAHEASRLLALGGPRLVRPDERMVHASFALDALAQLAGDPDKYGFYSIMEQQSVIEQALSTSTLMAKAALVLGFLGSPSSQQLLIDIASDLARPLPARQAAADAFKVAVGRRHLMLKRDQIMRQYDRYNQSESFDAGSQKVLASILDTIEAAGRE